MSEDDRQRWNRKYRDQAAREGSAACQEGGPAEFLVTALGYLPSTGRALDLAGGSGRNAVWLAERGLETTLIDVSDAGIAAARSRARDVGVQLRCQRVDLESEPLPQGPWDVIVCFQYLQRDLFPVFASLLNPGGTLVFCQATERNLERHAKPSRRFLLAEGEAEAMVTGVGLEILVLQEDWSEQGRHEARVIARL